MTLKRVRYIYIMWKDFTRL